MKIQYNKINGNAAKVVLKGKFLAIQCSAQETRKISNKHLKFTLQGTRKRNETPNEKERKNKHQNRNK